MQAHVAAVIARIRRPAAVVALAALPGAAVAQLPGLPVLQNAFGSGGLALGVNAGTAPGSQAFALAVGYGRGRLLAGGGIGSTRAAGPTGLGYGVRVAVPLYSLMGGILGLAAFAGLGGVAAKDTTLTQLPVGASVGWRHALGATRGFSVYASPYYGWFRRAASSNTASSGRLRVAAGVDVGITPRIGVTLGFEGGQGRTATGAGPKGSSFGLGGTWLWRPAAP